MYVCVYVCMYVCQHACMPACLHTYVCVCVLVHMQAQTYQQWAGGQTRGRARSRSQRQQLLHRPLLPAWPARQNWCEVGGEGRRQASGCAGERVCRRAGVQASGCAGRWVGSGRGVRGGDRYDRAETGECHRAETGEYHRAQTLRANLRARTQEKRNGYRWACSRGSLSSV